jgi:hypothetical protein
MQLLSPRRSPLRFIILTLLVGVAALAAIRWRGHVNVVPEPPTAVQSSIKLGATTSHLSAVLDFPVASIAAHLNAANKPFHFDSGGNPRVYGDPSLGVVALSVDVPAKRVHASATAGGKVQAEGQVGLHWSVGIDVSGNADGSFSPIVASDWSINPQLQLSAHVGHAVAQTRLPLVGDIDVTGHAQEAINKALPGITKALEGKLIEAVNLRGNATKVWNEIDSVHRVADRPPIWLRITPRNVTFGQPTYSTDSIKLGLRLDLETQAFIHESTPEVIKTNLPNLTVTGSASDDCTLSVPVEVSYGEVNEQLKAQLSKETINLPDSAYVTITDIGVEPFGEGLLMTIDFSGKKGWFKSASGRLYVVGIPVLDSATSNLRIEKLEYTAATKSILLQGVEWLAHPKFLDAMKAVSSVNLSRELSEAKIKANDELERLRKQLPKDIDAKLAVTDIKIDRLGVAAEKIFVVFNIKGKMSATLRQ